MRLFELLNKYVHEDSEHIVFTDITRSITNGQLWQFIHNNRKYLLEKGFHNQVVAYRIGSQIKFAMDFLSLMAAGCWVIPISSDVSEETYDKLMEKYKIFLTIDSYFLPEDYCGSTYKLFNQDEENCGIYHLTSGSTGEPKLCIRSLRALKEEGISYQRLFSLQSLKIVSLAPIYHSFSFGAAYMTALVSDSSIYLFDKFIPRRVVDVIGKWKANVVIAVPVMIKAVATVSLLEKYDFSKLSIVLVGTGMVPEEIRKIFKKRFGVYVSSNYGSTETGGIISRLTEEPAESIGKEMLGVEIKIIRKDGSEAEIGEEGEAYVKCKYMMDTYLGDETKSSYKDKFLPMGDLMIKDYQGLYYITGRIKNIINIGGKKVNPKEVEGVLLRYSGIKDCIVCKAIRTNNREIVKAVIVGEGLSKESIRKYLKKNLAEYKIPSLIEFVDSIERNELGKIVKEGTRGAEENFEG